MSGHLCLKWNNHSTSLLRSVGSIQSKDKYCDATILCRDKYFAVHRIVLSTCSEYFDEIFDKMKCQHPYIVFKDIDPREMEMLLNYMYQGEVNCEQDLLPSLIKAAESLKIKGLAVADDLPSDDEDCPKRKRTQTNSPNYSQSKRRMPEKTQRNVSRSNTPDALSSCVTANSIQDFGKEVHSSEKSGARNSEVNAANVKVEDPLNEPHIEEGWDDFSSEEGALTIGMGQEDELGGVPGMHFLFSEAQRGDISITRDPFYRASDGNYNCSYCPFFSNVRGTVSSHVKFKHTHEKPHPCPLCERRFTRKNDLRRHMVVHSGSKPYPCPYCESRFTQKSALKLHISTSIRCNQGRAWAAQNSESYPEDSVQIETDPNHDHPGTSQSPDRNYPEAPAPEELLAVNYSEPAETQDQVQSYQTEPSSEA